MYKPNPYDKLKENAIYTATKEELALMLYEGALKFCNQAIINLENKDYLKTNTSIMRVQDIIREFQLTLNRKYEISKDFDRMYNYILERLITANVKKDLDILKEVRELIREFRDTWKEAMLLAKKAK